MFEHASHSQGRRCESKDEGLGDRWDRREATALHEIAGDHEEWPIAQAVERKLSGVV